VPWLWICWRRLCNTISSDYPIMVEVQHNHCNQKVKNETRRKYIMTTTIHGPPNPFLTFNISIWKIITISISKIPYQFKYFSIQEKKMFFHFVWKAFLKFWLISYLFELWWWPN
jgi:hypothetical protein